ncbi:Hypothetical predicted protein [Mytilus galloprovincialis]|uniref:Uncharacterized protein n=1 Tax=Mytilus galloprovincialis TaxID=29158 RepID=A0A8B6EY56_MYTGA|nr:Hypothetical predicted protein [Mytilus galloprovincialis]
MVDEGILILEKDPLKTSETLEKEMQELIKFLKESGTLVSKARKIQWMDGFMTDLTVTEIDKQKVENKVAKIWDEDVANKYFIAKVFGIDITYGDINSLKDSNWLTDKVMDAYLTYIAQTEMDKGNIKVRHQLVSSTNNIINGKYVPGRHEKFAEKYLAGQCLLGITQEEVNNKRVTIAHTLMMFEGHMVGCCPCCGFRTNADEEQLIQCKICKNLFHRKTHCVGEAFATGTSNEDFVCEIDRTVEKKLAIL